MFLKSLIVPRAAERLLGEPRLLRARAKAERSRLRAGAPHRVEMFHDESDPWSRLLLSVLPELQARYDIDLVVHPVSPPDDAAAPERDKRAAYAAQDAERLAARAGLDVPPEGDALADTTAGDARLAALGHYQGGMIHYAGEWYWGLDRLHFLEARLAELSALKPDAPTAPIFAPPNVPEGGGQSGAELHWFLSFRSPYTAIIRDRVGALARGYGATLRLRYVLPMVMRGLPVPPAKRRYIPRDAAREARRLGVRFGRLMDPVGRPVELGYSLMPYARSQGRDYDYARCWLEAVWADGVDAGRSRGLRRIVERAGLDWQQAQDHLGTDAWRAEAEANRAEMMVLGLWGVPSFRVEDTAVWGQDRLWVVEDALKASCAM